MIMTRAGHGAKKLGADVHIESKGPLSLGLSMRMRTIPEARSSSSGSQSRFEDFPVEKIELKK
jgi:hypothetical protein